MKKKYSDLINRVKLRTNPDSMAMIKMYSEDMKASPIFENATLSYPDVVEYIRLSMKGVAKTYTDNTKLAAEKVKTQLQKSHGSEVDFEYQGSIMTNTHILKDHDIDLIQISNKSKSLDHSGLKNAVSNPSPYTCEEYQNLKKHYDNYSPYTNQISDLGKLRLKSEQALISNYKTVDTSKPKSIFVKVSSPERNVDVVTASYYKNIPYMKSNDKYKMGIQLYDKSTDSKLDVDYPFLSIRRINEKSIATGGRLKNMIRFLKNIKFDSDLIPEKPHICSFHINAICYDIKEDIYNSTYFLKLVSIIEEQLYKILNNDNYANNLMSVDGMEKIFEKNRREKMEEIKALHSEVDSILADLNIQNKMIG